jgi:DnaJ-class molecular chaperone
MSNFFMNKMVMNKNYYEILQIPSDASTSDIQRAYQQLRFLYHPNDKDFEDITEAYSVLSHLERRNKYDALMYDDNRYENQNYKVRSHSSEGKREQARENGDDALSVAVFSVVFIFALLLIFMLANLLMDFPLSEKEAQRSAQKSKNYQQPKNNLNPKKNY